jgi:hypothetical protein
MAFPVYTNEVENPTHFAKDATQPVYFSENNMPIGCHQTQLREYASDSLHGGHTKAN